MLAVHRASHVAHVMVVSVFVVSVPAIKSVAPVQNASTYAMLATGAAVLALGAYVGTHVCPTTVGAGVGILVGVEVVGVGVGVGESQ